MNGPRRFLAVLSLVACVAASPEAELTKEAIDRRIREHRTAEVTLTVLDATGKPLANSEVTVRQTRHQFLFGCNAFAINPADASEPQKLYQQRFAGLLNFGTLGFYWGSFEGTEGKPNVEKLSAQADWCRANGVTTKGHPLVWHQVAPKWLAGKSSDEILKLQLDRITRDVSGHTSHIHVWDVVNEAVVMPSYSGERTPILAVAKEVGTVELIKRAFARAKAADPKATLILNDYDTSPKYERLIEECLAAGVPIDVIGIQSHMHTGYWGRDKTWDVLRRFSRFGEPIHFTEVTMISGPRKRDMRWHGHRYTDWESTPEEEAKQAEQVAEFYTILFSHPSVQAVTWWDFSDKGAWLGAPAGLIRKDMSPKPAYEALLKRVKGEWWTAEVALKTDASGRATFRGFLGEYAVKTASGAGAFSVDRRGDVAVTARVGRD